MKHPWQIWLLFAICVAAAAGGMAWLTRQAIEADRMRRMAEAEAELEQRVSLALWQMDTELAPIIAGEVIRPAEAYSPSATPAPLPPFVLLQFEVQPNGSWSTPQRGVAQSSEQRQQAEVDASVTSRLTELSASVDVSQLIDQLPSTSLPTAAELERDLVTTTAVPASDLPSDDGFQFFAGNDLPPEGSEPKPPIQQMKGGKEIDFEKRNLRYQNAAQQSLLNRDLSYQELQGQTAEALQQVGVSRPLWMGDYLLLARRVNRNGGTVVQGAWLDWPRLKARLLSQVADTLPQADLVPLNGDTEPDPGRMLAGLPVRLFVEGPRTVTAVTPSLRWALWMGWSAALLSAIAAAILLHGVVTLSERRAAFVSSVTHELRTPLTTFRMYAEMLARGMVPDANRRQDYYQTLQREAERLTLLVENVLAYARLERGRKPVVQDRTTLGELLDRIGPRLSQRTEQSGMTCQITLNGVPHSPGETKNEGQSLDQEFTTDIPVVEQILFNLVDNAAKYANGAADGRIHIDATRNGSHVCLAVRDHGPGIHGGHRSSGMRAFAKSAQESADSAPGVGLGLALCRRLARQLGGHLDFKATPGGGTTVQLVLPHGADVETQGKKA